MKRIENAPERRAIYLGAAFILVGLIMNEVVIEWLFVADKAIESTLYSVVILVGEAILVLTGLFLVLRRPAVNLPTRSQLALLAFGILFPILTLEVGSRVWLSALATPEQFSRYVLFTDIEPQDFQWSPHHYLNHYPTPNYVKGLTTHNSLGFRGPEFAVAKPAGVFRIAVLGGSTTYTVRVEDDNLTFTAQLEQILKSDYGYDSVEVINGGVAAYNSWESLINLQFRILPLDPDLVIIYHGTNDVHARLVVPSSYAADDSGRRKQWAPPDVRWWEHSALLRILSRSLGFSSQVALEDFITADTYVGWPFQNAGDLSENDLLEILRQNPPIYFQRNLESMIDLSRLNQVDIMLATWAHSPHLNDYASTRLYEQGFMENNQVLLEVAASRGVPIFDFASVMPTDIEFWADGRHVNESGALKKAELFAEFLHNQRLLLPKP